MYEEIKIVAGAFLSSSYIHARVGLGSRMFLGLWIGDIGHMSAYATFMRPTTQI